jgi:hypothetical protein
MLVGMGPFCSAGLLQPGLVELEQLITVTQAEATGSCPTHSRPPSPPSPEHSATEPGAR